MPITNYAQLDGKIRKKAEEKEIILFGPEELAEMIIENCKDIDETYKSKLNVINLIQPIVEIEHT